MNDLVESLDGVCHLDFFVLSITRVQGQLIRIDGGSLGTAATLQLLDDVIRIWLLYIYIL